MQRWIYLVLLLTIFEFQVARGADPEPWKFQIVAETGKEFSGFPRPPVISCSGEVAFLAESSDGAGIYRGSPGAVRTVHRHSGPVDSYRPPAVSAGGELVFAYTSPRGSGSISPDTTAIFIDTAGSLLKAVGGNINEHFGPYAINNRGLIAFAGSLSDGKRTKGGLFTFDGQRSNLVIDDAGQAFAEFAGNGLDINDSGQVVFTGTLKDGSHGVFLLSLSGITPIADTTTGISTFLNPVINSVGDVIVFGYRRIDERTQQPGQYLIKSGSLMPVGGDQYPFVGGGVSINDAGAIVFSAMKAASDPDVGLYYGPDPSRHKLIAVGDQVAGREIKAVRISDHALTNRGQVAMRVEFVDGSSAIVLATPRQDALPKAACPPSAKPSALLATARSAAGTNSVPAVGAAAVDLSVTAPFAILQEEVPESDWLEAEKRRYSDLLVTGDFDTLVVPFLPDGDTLDAAGRTLLARLLADNLERAGARIPDPGLVEKALGAPLRYAAPKAIFLLARKLGTSRVIIGHVGHDRNFRMTVSVDVYQESAGQIPTEHSTRRRLTESGIGFSDENLPYMVFAPISLRWASQISGKQLAQPATVQQTLEAAATFPQTFGELVARSKISKLEAARQLVFLGSLYPWTIDSRSRDQLFERALLVLEGVNRNAPGYRLLKSQALIALNRRPASLQALGKPGTAAEKALLAYLNSDLPELDKQIPLIQDKSLRLIATFNRQRLHFEYALPLDEAAAEAILADDPTWGAFALQRYLNGEEWGRMSNALTKVGLDQLVPDVAPGIEEILATLAPRGRGDYEFEIARAIRAHVNAAYLAADPAENIASASHPRELDLLELANETMLAGVLSKSRAHRTLRGRPEDALELLNSYRNIFATNPQFTMEEGVVYRSPSSSGAQRLFAGADGAERGKELCARAFVWNPVQNEDTDMVSRISDAYFPALRRLSESDRDVALFRNDFPARYFGLPHVRADDNRQKQVVTRRCLDYTLSMVSCARQYQEALAQSSSNPEVSARQLLNELDGRFVGSPGRMEVITWLRQQLDSEYTELDAYREAIAAGSTAWKPYEEVGLERAKAGDYKAAAKIFDRYPGFSAGAAVDRVLLSNYAYDAGNHLYWRGAWEEASSFYKISADLRTGSEASLAAASRLALLKYDWDAAKEYSLARAERYRSPHAYRDYIALLHFTGDTSLGWSMFDQDLDIRNRTELWTGAYVGHRAQNASHESIVAWATTPRRGFTGKVGGDGIPPAMRYIFLTAVTDRKPPDNLAGTLRNLYPDAAWEPRLISDRSGFSAEEQARLNAYKDYQRLARSAEAVTAFNRGDFQRAYQLLDSMNELNRLQEFLPYYTVAALKSGNSGRLNQYLEGSAQRYASAPEWAALRDMQFHDNLARALIHGGRNRHDEALEHLKLALNFRPFTENRSIFTDYQLLEVAEWLYEGSKDDRYRDFVYRHAKQFAVIQPMYPWPYAFAARRAPSREDRVREAAIVLMLDPGSLRLSELPEADLAAARERLKKNGNPFVAPLSRDKDAGFQAFNGQPLE